LVGCTRRYFQAQKLARLETLSDESKSLTDISDPAADEGFFNDDESESTDDEDEESLSIKSKDSAGVEMQIEDETIGIEIAKDGEDVEQSSESEEGGDDDSDEVSGGETDEEDDYEDDEEFDEEAYMLQLEEEAFERELRMLTMEAIEKGKNASRKQVGDSMISGSQIIKRKPTDVTKSSWSDTLTPNAGVALGGEVGISFQVLKKGSKGKIEVKELVVPVDTNLAMAATRHDDAAAKERDEIKQRVLRYEAQSESSGGNVYLEQERLQRNRNRPLSMEEIDKNFGTTGGVLHPNQLDKKAPANNQSSGRGGGRGGGPNSSMGRLGGRGGRFNASGRHLF
jgi:regulator of nonsense transcripts 2